MGRLERIDLLMHEWSSQINKCYINIPKLEPGTQPVTHIAFIEDRRRVAALDKGLPPEFGYTASCATRWGIMRAFRSWRIPRVTFGITFSDPNGLDGDKDFPGTRQRALISFLENPDLEEELYDSETRVVHLGSKNRISTDLKRIISHLEETTAGNSRLMVNLVIGYDYRRDSPYPDGVEQAPFDLIIRTSGRGISNRGSFLPELVTPATRWVDTVPFPLLEPVGIQRIIRQTLGVRAYG